MTFISAFHLFGQLLDRLWENGRVRGSEIEPAKAEFHSSVREQRQAEASGSRSRLLINSVFEFRNQPGFCSGRKLHKVSIFDALKSTRCFNDFTHVLLSDLSDDSISGEGSLRVASRLYGASLNRVAISHETLKRAVACVHRFVQRKFFTETGISMLNTAVTAADAVWHSSKLDLWEAIGVDDDPVIAHLKSCREKIVSRRKTVKDTRERWFDAETIASSAVGEAAPRTTVRISDVVEVGDVQHIEEHSKLGLPCCS